MQTGTKKDKLHGNYGKKMAKISGHRIMKKTSWKARWRLEEHEAGPWLNGATSRSCQDAA